MSSEETKAAAFFDLDRTLIAGSSAFEFARACYKSGLISRRQLVADGFTNIKFRLQGSTDDQVGGLIERIQRTVKGVPVKELGRLAPDILSGVLPRLYPQMLKEAYAHQDDGRKVYICTAAGQELANLLAEVLQFDGAIATKLEHVDGVYTGTLAGPFTYHEGKAVVMRELAGQEGIDLSASYSYSDSISDLPMLELVGYPVAVNPDHELKLLAKERNWRILRFEKLGQKLKLASAIGFAATASGVYSAALLKRQPTRLSKRLRPADLEKLLQKARSAASSAVKH